MLNRFFYYFLIARSTTVFADIVYIMVITLFIYDITGSATYAAVFPVISTIGGLITSFFAPLVVNKFGHIKVLRYTPLIKVIIITLFVLFFGSISEYWYIIFVVVAIVSLLQGLTRPLFSSIIPMLVEEIHLVKANGMLSFSFQTLQIAGYSLTGISVAFVGIMPTFYLCITLLWISWIFLLLTIKQLDVETEEANQSAKRTDILKEGWQLLWANKRVRAVTLMDVSEGVAGAVWIGAITLIFVDEVLQQGTDWWGYINSAYYAGAILGGAVAVYFSKYISKNLLINMAVGTFSYGVLSILYGLNSLPIVAIILVLLMGPVYQIRDVSQQTLLQSSVPASQLSKIYAAHSVLLSSVGGLSVLLVGITADLFGVRWVYILGGILVILTSSVSLLILKNRVNKEENETKILG